VSGLLAADVEVAHLGLGAAGLPLRLHEGEAAAGAAGLAETAGLPARPARRLLRIAQLLLENALRLAGLDELADPVAGFELPAFLGVLDGLDDAVEVAHLVADDELV